MILEETERKLKIATKALERLIKYVPYKSCQNCEAYRIADIALREMARTKWEYQKVEDTMSALIKKYCKGDTWAGFEDATDEVEKLWIDSGWDEEEYHWECCRHSTIPPTCACWDKFPENKGNNPLPL